MEITIKPLIFFSGTRRNSCQGQNGHAKMNSNGKIILLQNSLSVSYLNN